MIIRNRQHRRELTRKEKKQGFTLDEYLEYLILLEDESKNRVCKVSNKRVNLLSLFGAMACTPEGFSSLDKRSF